MNEEATVLKKTEGRSAYYTVRWSPLALADRYEIVRSVPSIGGVYELYYLDDHKVLVPLLFVKAWYGGLRNSIRQATDPELSVDPLMRKVLNDHPAYYRYSALESSLDMADLAFFFHDTRSRSTKDPDHSHRYDHIYVNEVSPNKVITI